MTKAQAKKRIEKLCREIDHHRYQYHVLNTQEISDAALDSLKDELSKLEQDFPELITPDSPTQRVAGEPLAGFVKVAHKSRMLSLNDAFNRADLDDWLKRLHRVDPDATFDFFAEPKIDGLALSLVYQDGSLMTAATRGDGRVGEDVTMNIRTIESVPLTLRTPKRVSVKGRVEVRGEVYMTDAVFDRINAERAAAGEELYRNPRNTAAGSIRQLDPSLVAARELRFLAYALPTDLGQDTHAEEHALLSELGFATDELAQECADVEAIMDYYESLMKKRDRLDHMIDGMVVVVNSNRQFDRFGVVGKAPRGAIAMKFPAEQATTVVEDIVVQVGRTGALTPVAHLRPVEVAGSIVQRATLHNSDEIDRLGVQIGDTVVIEKAGDIIPDIVQVLTDMRDGKEKPFQMPRKCPVCTAPVVKHADLVAHYCDNPDCDAKKREGFYHFVSKKALNIDGLGPKIIDQLLDEGLVKTPADLFDLTAEQLAPLERFAQTAASNVVQSVTAARRVDLYRLIYALGIRHVGEQTAVMLADTFGSFKKFRAATQEQLEKIHDVGPAATHTIINYFADKKNAAFIDALVEHLTITNPKKRGSGTLDGKTFLFTGTLEKMTRDNAKALVREHGGLVATSVTKKLNYLVVGGKPGSKVTKAEKLGVRVLTEKAFFEMLGRKV